MKFLILLGAILTLSACPKTITWKSDTLKEEGVVLETNYTPAYSEPYSDMSYDPISDRWVPVVRTRYYSAKYITIFRCFDHDTVFEVDDKDTFKFSKGDTAVIFYKMIMKKKVHKDGTETPFELHDYQFIRAIHKQ